MIIRESIGRKIERCADDIGKRGLVVTEKRRSQLGGCPKGALRKELESSSIIDAQLRDGDGWEDRLW